DRSSRSRQKGWPREHRASRAAEAKVSFSWRVAPSVDREPCQGTIDFQQVCGCQVYIDRCDVLIQALEPASAGNRHYPGLSRHEPGEGQLSGCDLPSAREPAQLLNQGSIGTARNRRETRHEVAVVVPVKPRMLIDLPGEKTSAQGTEGNEPD